MAPLSDSIDALQAFQSVLAPSEANRVLRVMEKLDSLGMKSPLLTGGLALEATLPKNHRRPRSLNDIDLVVPDFASLPPSLSRGFLVRHVHPKASGGGLLIQLIDAREKLRIDVFQDISHPDRRNTALRLGRLAIDAVEWEVLAVLAARILLGLRHGASVAPKCSADFHRLLEVICHARVEEVWSCYRRPSDPTTFSIAKQQIEDALRSGRGRLEEPRYSQDIHASCAKCVDEEPFRLDSAEAMVSIMGYC